MDKLEVNIPPIVLILISILFSFFGLELPQFILNMIDPSPILL